MNKPELMEGKARWDFLAEIAHLYYNQQLTQQQIGERYELTRFKVAQYLAAAREEGVVSIDVQFSDNRGRALEQQLAARFGLKEAIVLNNRFLTQEQTLRQLGRLAAEYLTRELLSGDVMGLAWGKTIQSAVADLSHTGLPPIEIFPLTGFADLATPTLEASALAQTVASTCGGRAHTLPAPLYISDPQLLHRLRSEPAIAQVLALGARMKAALAGISSTSTLPDRHSCWCGYQQPHDSLTEIVGSVFGLMLTPDGDIADIPLNQKLMSVGVNELMQTPHRMAMVLGRHKVQAVAAALRSGLVNVLVTDVAMSSALVTPMDS